MKMSFAIPDEIGRQFKKAVPAGQRSAVVTSLLKKKLTVNKAELERVCDRVNRLAHLNNEMTEWEGFDDSDA
jgi:hypothetical protein